VGSDLVLRILTGNEFQTLGAETRKARDPKVKLWRRRPHTQLLPQLTGHIIDSNFITRILYKTFTDSTITTHTLIKGQTHISARAIVLSGPTQPFILSGSINE